MIGSLVLQTAPTVEPITTAEAKSHLRVDAAGDDTLIGALIDAAIAMLDGRDGWLGRALCTQTWDWYLDAFPDEDVLYVPLPPLVSVSSITYLDTAGASQTWGATNYTVDIRKGPGRITPAYGVVWPSTRDVVNAVIIRFVAGYGAAAAVPETIKLGLKALVAQFYEHREPVVVGTIATKIPDHVDRLLAPYRVWSLQ